MERADVSRELRKWVNEHRVCEHFNDPPCATEDVAFLEPYWTFCTRLEGECGNPNCPVVDRGDPER